MVRTPVQTALAWLNFSSEFLLILLSFFLCSFFASIFPSSFLFSFVFSLFTFSKRLECYARGFCFLLLPRSLHVLLTVNTRLGCMNVLILEAAVCNILWIWSAFVFINCFEVYYYLKPFSMPINGGRRDRIMSCPADRPSRRAASI